MNGHGLRMHRSLNGGLHQMAVGNCKRISGFEPLFITHESLLAIIKRTLLQVVTGNRVHDLQKPCEWVVPRRTSRFEWRMASNGGRTLQMNQWLCALMGHNCALTRALRTQGETNDFRQLNPKSFGGRVDKGWVSNSGTLHHTSP